MDAPEDFREYQWDVSDRFDDCRPEMMPDDLRPVGEEEDDRRDGVPFEEYLR